MATVAWVEWAEWTSDLLITTVVGPVASAAGPTTVFVLERGENFVHPQMVFFAVRVG